MSSDSVQIGRAGRCVLGSNTEYEEEKTDEANVAEPLEMEKLMKDRLLSVIIFHFFVGDAGGRGCVGYHPI